MNYYLAAWNSICDWCKEHSTHIRNRGVHVVKHSEHEYIMLYIRKNGDVQLSIGKNNMHPSRVYCKTHATYYTDNVKMSDIVLSSNRPYVAHKLKCDSNFVYFRDMERLVNDWQYFKNNIISQIKQYNSVSNFNP